MMPVSREEFQTMANTMCNDLAIDMLQTMMKAFDALLPSEVEKLDTNPTSWLLVRAIGMAAGERVVSQCFDVEAIKSLKTRIKRILNKRYWY